ncbi:amidohydrolase family protein [Streptomyces palmae]|uniref:Amidohydrolase n=1 Tax=Streptomyces palmae TaxID=1701085 RepID=A0A4Z0HD87_9ACTN|nr:amidohydrolase family protein [Streptomyces palmae]TGB18430.1 amidohydrolase [Streptomyces palmae]
MAEPLPLPALVDQHCHGVLRDDLSDERFESLLTESDAPAAPGTGFFDTQLGFAVRRWCPPLLGLYPHCSPGRYLARRRELGAGEVNRRLLRAAGIGVFLVDTGLPGELTTPWELATAAGGTGHEIVRLERLAEDVAGRLSDPGSFGTAVRRAVDEAARTAVGFKSIAAYRCGLDLDPTPPTEAEVRAAAVRWSDSQNSQNSRDGQDSRDTVRRLTDPVLVRHLLWCAARTGLPLQLHTGFGDPDLTLHRSDPLLLTDFVRAVRPTGCTLVLLHCYPYHRGAAYLAHAFPHVYADVGLSLGYTGVRAQAVLAEFLELAPFGKLLFSTDAHGLAELYLVGVRLFRRALGALLSRWVAQGDWSRRDAERVAVLIAADNARRVYGLGPGSAAIG